MKTCLSYYGGKQRIATQIVPHIMAIPHTVYIEPFFGGGAVLYAKGKIDRGNSGYYREAINDLNKQLITFWRVAREQPSELARWIELTPYSQEEYREAQKIYNNPSEYSDLKVAWATYIQCNMSFANKIGRGWAAQVIGRNSAATWVNRAARLPECFERLKDVYIGCEDALSFIKRFDCPHGLIYADSPYPNTDQGHYDGYTLDDYQKLCDVLDNCESSYVLSNYHQDIAPKSAQKCIEIEAVMSAANGRTSRKNADSCKRIEKLWICDRSKNIRPDLQVIAKMPSKQLQGSLF
jgi:Site-specific DNA methylase